MSLGPAKCRKNFPQLARSEKEGILKNTSTRSATLWVGRAGEPNIGIRLSKFVQFLSFFIKRSLLHRDTNFAQPVDSPFCLRIPVQRTIILRPDVQRGCRLGSTLLKADSGPVALCLPIMIQNCLINCNFRAIRLRRRIILAGEERRLLAAEAAESYLEKKDARSASSAEEARQIAPKSPRTM